MSQYDNSQRQPSSGGCPKCGGNLTEYTMTSTEATGSRNNTTSHIKCTECGYVPTKKITYE